MPTTPTRSKAESDLRHLAEARLSKRPGDRPAKAGRSEPGLTDLRLLHELQVHQVELGMQNSELRRARDELEASLENYTSLYDFAPVGYFTLAIDGSIQQANLTGAVLVGIDRASLETRLFATLVSTPMRPLFHDFLARVFAGRARQSGDFELSGPGRPSRTVNIEAQRLVDRQECRVAVMDITERKLQEEKTRISEVRYRRLFEAAHDGVLLIDPGTRKITDANPFMTTLLGYPRALLVGKELYEIGLLKDEAASREMFRKLKVEHEVRYENLPLESQDGRHQEVEVVANLYAENGHSVIQCNIRDITQRKHMEDALRRNEALFAALIAQAPVGVYVVDARLRMQKVNPRALPVFKNVKPLLGRSFSEIIRELWPRRIAEQVLRRFRHTLETGKPYHSPEFHERRRDTGAREVYEWQIQRVTLPEGEHGVVCFFSNITSRKRAEEAQRRVAVLDTSNRRMEREIVRRRTVEEALRKSEGHQRRLLRQSRQLQERLRNLSHKILRAQEEERKRISRELHDVIAQTLVGINIHLAALTRGHEKNPRGLQRELKRTQRLVETSVDNMHRFARELRPKVLDDLGLIPALHAHLEDFTSRTGVRARLTAFAEVEKLHITQRTVLYRVAQEALNNVASHARASRVEVSLEKLGDHFCMRIKDDGKSFDLDRALRAKGNTRLGLLGMRERLEMIGGSFEVESSPGAGTTILARLPSDPAGSPTKKEPAAGSPRPKR